MSPFLVALALVSFISGWFYLAFVWSGMLLKIKRHLVQSVWNTIWRWTKWPAFAGLFIQPWSDFAFDNHHWYSPLAYVLNAVVWWSLRNAGDDDISKKLKKKLKEKIEAINGKLVVIPATT